MRRRESREDQVYILLLFALIVNKDNAGKSSCCVIVTIDKRW